MQRTVCGEPRSAAWGSHDSTTSSEGPGLPGRTGKGAKSWSRGLERKKKTCIVHQRDPLTLRRNPKKLCRVLSLVTSMSWQTNSRGRRYYFINTWRILLARRNGLDEPRQILKTTESDRHKFVVIYSTAVDWWSRWRTQTVCARAFSTVRAQSLLSKTQRHIVSIFK